MADAVYVAVGEDCFRLDPASGTALAMGNGKVFWLDMLTRAMHETLSKDGKQFWRVSQFQYGEPVMIRHDTIITARGLTSQRRSCRLPGQEFAGRLSADASRRAAPCLRFSSGVRQTAVTEEARGPLLRSPPPPSSSSSYSTVWPS